MGFEPTTSSMPSRRAPNCATAPPSSFSLTQDLPEITARTSILRRLLRRFEELEKCGVGKDRDQRGDGRGVVNLAGDEPRAERDLCEDERKFADLRQADADALGGVPMIAESPDDSTPHQ